MANGSEEGQSVDFLIVVMVLVLLPVRVKIEPVSAGGFVILRTS